MENPGLKSDHTQPPREGKCKVCDGDNIGEYSFRVCDSSRWPFGRVSEMFTETICNECAIRNYPKSYVKTRIGDSIAIGLALLVIVTVIAVSLMITLGKPGQALISKQQVIYGCCIIVGSLPLAYMLALVLQIRMLKSKITRDPCFVEKLWNNSTRRERFRTFIDPWLDEAVRRMPRRARLRTAGHRFPVIHADISTCDYCGTRKSDHEYEFSYGDLTVTQDLAGPGRMRTTTVQAIRGCRKFKLCTDCIEKPMRKKTLKRLDRREEIYSLIEPKLTEIVIAEYGMDKVWSPWEVKDILAHQSDSLRRSLQKHLE